MSIWSQSHILQALGWATLNSLWQTAFLWFAFSSLTYFVKIRAALKYQVAVAGLLISFVWFVATFFSYYQNNTNSFAIFENSVEHSNTILQACLFSASITYLLLLLFPAVRLFRNWQFLQVIKSQGLTKASAEYRLFAQKISLQLNITKKVKLAVSELVASPITVGYLKPVILLPVAMFNHLSTAQAEAILLHELSHIRRYDYLVNLIISVIHVTLYFNPFAKALINVIESEREICCDETVLRFGYNNIDYASALLQLQKVSVHHTILTIGATGKQNLLSRIEKIIGIEKKRPVRLVQALSVFAALFCILLFNSILIIKDAKKGTGLTYAYEQPFPWQLNIMQKKGLISSPPNDVSHLPTNRSTVSDNHIKIDILNLANQATSDESFIADSDEKIQPVNFDWIEGNLTKEEKDNVESTVAATKKVVGALEWKQIDDAIADVLSEKEKAIAKQEYLQEVEKINWKNIEKNLKAGYDQLDWNAINANVSKAMVQVQLDSLQTVYNMAYTEIKKLEKTLKSKGKNTDPSPLPDASLEDIKIAKEALLKNLDSIKTIRPKKIVRL